MIVRFLMVEEELRLVVEEELRLAPLTDQRWFEAAIGEDDLGLAATESRRAARLASSRARRLLASGQARERRSSWRNSNRENRSGPAAQDARAGRRS